MDIKTTPYEISTRTASTVLTSTIPHGYGYGHYISYYGHYSYILLILMGITVLLGSLLVAYVKKIDSGLMRRSNERERNGNGTHRQSCPLADENECDELKKDLPPEYQIALEMPRPDINDYTRFFEYTLVHSNTSILSSNVQTDNDTVDEVESISSDIVLPIDVEQCEDVNDVVSNDRETGEELPTYDDYIESLKSIAEV